MTVKTCTKVNIGLHVLRRRADGYHDLDTLFVPYYGFGDLLTVEPAAATTIEIIREEGVDWDPQQDLTIRAWRLLKADFPALPCVRIKLEKHAPVGSGLGGGSADAAFMLRALRDIGSLPLSDADLVPYAAQLGSDCAFFVGSTLLPMLGSGRGNILEPFDIDLSAYELRVEVPEGISVSTREAYSEVVPREAEISRLRPEGSARNDSAQSERPSPSVISSETEISRPRPEGSARNDSAQSERPSPSVISSETEWSREIPLREALRLPVEQWKDYVVNDFEKGVFAKYPEIAALKQKFYDSGAIYAAMSGSGSAVFGLFRK